MNLAVIGLQWGDEGKGKAINYLAPEYEVVVRYQGGHNAGHTIYHKGEKIILHLLPSGIFSPSTVSVIGNGVVVNPIKLSEEIKGVEKFGVNLNNLVLSSTAPLILPEHKELDVVFENSRYVEIGTTRRGIGPAYEDLIGRRAVFTGDLFDKDRFYKKIKPLNEYYNKLIKTFEGEEIDIESYIDEYLETGKFLKEFTKNSIYLLNKYYKEGKKILFEGAQGVLLDINFGTFPFVTSSNPTVGGMFTGTGLPHKSLDTITGITKAYTTRVGGGPFPSELGGDTGEYLRKKGNEYGSTTGRPRRVGWLDLVALKYAVMVNGVDDIFLTKLDVLDDLDEVGVVTGYKVNNSMSSVFEPDHIYLDNVVPEVKMFRGWRSDTSGMRVFDELPAEAKHYIRFIEEFSDVPVGTVSVGVSSEQTIKKRNNMYDKNQIIDEIKRVAKYLKTASLKKKDFIKNTMIPVSTINFYISSWPEALSEAGLDEGKPDEEVRDQDLLKDLLRIENEYGQTPTYALIEKNGKYSKEDYENKWRNLDDAFKLATSKYKKMSDPSPDKTILMNEGSGDLLTPDKTMTANGKREGIRGKELDLEETLVSVKPEDIELEQTGSGEFSDNFGSDNILTIDAIQNKESDIKKEEEEDPSFDYVSGDDEGIDNLMSLDVKKRKKAKIIPETIKPATGKDEPGDAEELNFRGIKYAPIDTRGVIFIFGMVSEELSYIIESFSLDRFCFSGKRNLSLKSEQWESVNIGFSLNSKDLEGSGSLTKHCELLVCWKHEWKKCPVEVLELSTILPGLENY